MTMNIEAIAPINSKAIDPISITAMTKTGDDFAAMLTQGVQQVNGDIAKSEQLLKAYASGEAVPSHELMLALEEAKLSLQLAVEVRNKMVEAYQEITRMQV